MTDCTPAGIAMGRHRNARAREQGAAVMSARSLRRGGAQPGSLWTCDAPGCLHVAPRSWVGWVSFPVDGGATQHACCSAHADVVLEQIGGMAVPRTRADCSNVPRPCPWVRCVWNLYLEVVEDTGSIRLCVPDLEPWEMPERWSCALDVAERGGCGPTAIASALNMTRERMRIVLLKAVAKAMPGLERFHR